MRYLVVVAIMLVGCTRNPGPARPRAATSVRVSHAANVATAGALFGLSFFETYANKRGADRLSDPEWTRYRQGVSSQPVPSIPVFQLASVGSGGSVLFFTRDYRKREFMLAGAGLLLAVAGVITTLAITAPAQSDVDGFDPDNLPADIQAYRDRLHRANVIRTVVHGVALGINITALTIAW